MTPHHHPSSSSITLVLYQPEIPGNTGTLMRLAACWGSPLELVGPLGFVFSHRQLRRSGMDYSDLSSHVMHASWEDYLRAHGGMEGQSMEEGGGRMEGQGTEEDSKASKGFSEVRGSRAEKNEDPWKEKTSPLGPKEGIAQGTHRKIAVVPHAGVSHRNFSFAPGDHLIMGSEGSGLPKRIMEACQALVHIPMVPQARSLNLAIASAILWSEALGQIHALPPSEYPRQTPKPHPSEVKNP